MSKYEGSSWEAPCVTLYGTVTAGTLQPVLLDNTGGLIAQMYASKDDGTKSAVPLDTKTAALMTTAIAEAALYAGDSFTTSYTAAIATDTTLTLLAVTTASTKYTNLDIELSISCVCDIKLYELPLINAVAGTTSTVYNCNRTSSVTSSTTVTHTPSAVTVSTTILYAWNAYAAQTRKLPTFRLNASKNYYLLLTPTAAGTNTLGATLTWTDVSNGS